MFAWLVEGMVFGSSASDNAGIEFFVFKVFALGAGVLLLLFCCGIVVEDVAETIVDDFSTFNFHFSTPVATPLVSLVLIVVVVKGR